MSKIESLNLIRLFDLYLAVMLAVGFYRRWKVYRDALLLVFGFAFGRWGRLLSRLNQHRREIINWPTLGPMVFALALMAVQMIASRLIFPQANLTVHDLLDPWWQLAVALVAFVPMAAVDFYFVLRVGRFDHGETVKYFNQAEQWAGTWQAKAVRAVTLGRVNPDRMVDTQVKEGLQQLGATLTWAMWWVSTQVILRLIFGLTLWLLWFIEG